MKTFNKVSAYILQQDVLPTFLTSEELMMIAAKLKLGDQVSLEEKGDIVNEILNVLGLSSHKNTRTECLSGGQKKRLSIALELVNNPPVIFLDEPCSGLDTVAISQCIHTLKTLTGQGRTIICTIHQPPASIFRQFHQVYFIAEGMCVYNGSVPNILPHLATIGIECPISYTPAEHIIELVHTHKECINLFIQAINNGKINKRDLTYSSIQHSLYEDNTTDNIPLINFPTTFWMQFLILYKRIMLQLIRNKTMISMQILVHTLPGILIGLIFFGIGNNASMAYPNFKFCICVIVFFIFTYMFIPVLHFPIQMEIFKREYFNRWYSLKAYFLATSLQNLPMLVTSGFVFTLITYGLAAQPLELNRFIMYMVSNFITAFAADGLGLAIASVFNEMAGSVIASSSTVLPLVLAVYGAGYGSIIDNSMRIIMGISYIRYSLTSMCNALFANREMFDCTDELYCHYKDPKQLLRDLGMQNSSYLVNIIGLSIFAIIFRVIAYLGLRYRLNSQFSNNILMNYLNKLNL